MKLVYFVTFVLLLSIQLIFAPFSTGSDDVLPAASRLSERLQPLLGLLHEIDYFVRLEKLTVEKVDDIKESAKDVIQKVTEAVEPSFAKITESTSLTSSAIGNGIAALRRIDGTKVAEGKRFDGHAPSLLSNEDFYLSGVAGINAKKCSGKVNALKTSNAIRNRDIAAACISEILQKVGSLSIIVQAIDKQLGEKKIDPLVAALKEVRNYRSMYNAVKRMMSAMDAQEAILDTYGFVEQDELFCQNVNTLLEAPEPPHRSSSGNGRGQWMESLFDGKLSEIEETLRPTTSAVGVAFPNAVSPMNKKDLMAECRRFIAAVKNINRTKVDPILATRSCVQEPKEEPAEVKMVLNALSVLSKVEPDLQRLRTELAGVVISSEEEKTMKDLRDDLTRKELIEPVVNILNRLSSPLEAVSLIVNQNAHLKDWIVFSNLEEAVTVTKKYISECNLDTLQQCVPEPSMTDLELVDESTVELMKLKTEGFPQNVRTAAESIAGLIGDLEKAVKAEARDMDDSSWKQMFTFLDRLSSTKRRIQEGDVAARRIGQLQAQIPKIRVLVESKLTSMDQLNDLLDRLTATTSLAEETKFSEVAENFEKLSNFSFNKTGVLFCLSEIEKALTSLPSKHPSALESVQEIRRNVEEEWTSVSDVLDSASKAFSYLQKALNIFIGVRPPEPLEHFEVEERKEKQRKEEEEKKNQEARNWEEDDGTSWPLFVVLGLTVMAIGLVVGGGVWRMKMKRKGTDVIASLRTERDFSDYSFTYVLMQDARLEMNSKSPSTGTTRLFDAASNRQWSRMDELLGRGALVDVACGPRHRTVLAELVANGDLEHARQLLEAGASLDHWDAGGNSLERQTVSHEFHDLFDAYRGKRQRRRILPSNTRRQFKVLVLDTNKPAGIHNKKRLPAHFDVTLGFVTGTNLDDFTHIVMPASSVRKERILELTAENVLHWKCVASMANLMEPGWLETVANNRSALRNEHLFMLTGMEFNGQVHRNRLLQLKTDIHSGRPKFLTNVKITILETGNKVNMENKKEWEHVAQMLGAEIRSEPTGDSLDEPYMTMDPRYRAEGIRQNSSWILKHTDSKINRVWSSQPQKFSVVPFGFLLACIAGYYILPTDDPIFTVGVPTGKTKTSRGGARRRRNDLI